MKILRRLVAVGMAVALGGAGPIGSVMAAEANSVLPGVIQAGFAAWSRGGAALALDAWQKGGLIEGDRKVVTEVAYFKRIEPAVGNFKAYDVIQVQKIGLSSQIVYLAMSFDRAAVYVRFLLYRTDQDWVVQNMDFNLKPEAIIPWTAFGGTTGTDTQPSP